MGRYQENHSICFFFLSLLTVAGQFTGTIVRFETRRWKNTTRTISLMWGYSPSLLWFWGASGHFPFRNTVSPHKSVSALILRALSDLPWLTCDSPAAFRGAQVCGWKASPVRPLGLRSPQPGRCLSARRFFPIMKAEHLQCSRVVPQQESYGSVGWMQPLDVTVVPRKPSESHGRRSDGSYGVAEHAFPHLLRDLLLWVAPSRPVSDKRSIRILGGWGMDALGVGAVHCLW